MAAPTTPILDQFNRADQNLDTGNWAGPFTGTVGPLKILSNEVASMSGTYGTDSYWIAESFGVDQEVYATCTVKPDPNEGSIFQGVWLPLRIIDPHPGLSIHSGYFLAMDSQVGTDDIYIYRFDSGAGTIIEGVSLEYSAGDKFLFRAVGSLLTGYRNDGGGWAEIISTVDTTYVVGGWIGLHIEGSTGRWDDFGGGNYVPFVPQIYRRL